MSPLTPNWVTQLAVSGLRMGRALLVPTAFGVQGILVDKDGRVLLARHTYTPGLALLGGGVGRGEPPEAALLRELGEELGTFRADPPVLIGLYTRRSGWLTTVIALYRLTNAEVEFRANFEIREVIFVDPAAPPPETTPATRRRLAEHVGTTPPSPFW